MELIFTGVAGKTNSIKEEDMVSNGGYTIVEQSGNMAKIKVGGVLAPYLIQNGFEPCNRPAASKTIAHDDMLWQVEIAE